MYRCTFRKSSTPYVKPLHALSAVCNGAHAQDGEGFDVVPGSELVIARTAHSNNSSNYYVNGRKSSFSDVTALLKAKGVDLDNNRFLILQGEVEQISMMKPKAQQPNETGLLEYLEDIIGTDQYVEPIEEHYKRLEEVSEARQGMVARVKVVERERDALEDDKLLAESYLSKQRAMHACKATTAQLQMRAGEVCLRRRVFTTGWLPIIESHYEDTHHPHVATHRCRSVAIHGALCVTSSLFRRTSLPLTKAWPS